MKMEKYKIKSNIKRERNADKEIQTKVNKAENRGNSAENE